MADDTVNIEIDGVALTAPKGAMLIQVADDAGIYIPRFCYHKKLSIAANCRMCLVEVEKAPKPLPACATPVAEGMKVFTRSQEAIDAQKGTMEFLLINHPLDCPICDQGGECELQDLSMGYGAGVSRYTERKRVVEDQNLGPLISTDMTRCIHCTRCVRFGQEIAGIMELAATGRGENMRIGTYVERAVTSEMSGNVIDLCPVGALNAKPSRMSARGWELTQYPSVGPHDCVGSNLFVHTLRGEVKRVVPRENEAVNECWISDRDRFSYQGVASGERLLSPMIREADGGWRECDWETALQAASDGLRRLVQTHKAEQLGVLVSPNATLEEMHLLQRLARGLGTVNLDHRLRQWDFSDDAAAPVFPWLGQPIEALERVDAALLIGSDVRHEQPLIAHRLRKATRRGAPVMSVGSRNFNGQFYSEAPALVCAPGAMVQTLAAVTRAALEAAGRPVPGAVDKLAPASTVTESQRDIAERLRAAERATVLLGSQAAMHPGQAALRTLARWLSDATGAVLGYLPDGANSAGAWIAGVLPHRGPGGHVPGQAGLNARTMVENPRKGYLLQGVEPEFDCADAATTMAALNSAELVVCVTPYVSAAMKSYAHVLLPSTTFAETSGTFVNVEGRWQSFRGARRPLGEARPGWKILRVLGNLLHVSGFDYVSSEDVCGEVQGEVGDVSPDNTTVAQEITAAAVDAGVQRVSGVASHRGDGLVRRAVALQQTRYAEEGHALRLNRTTAQGLGLLQAERVRVSQGNSHTVMPLAIDDSVADQCAWIAAGTEASASLGPLFGAIELEAD
jgi:NADH-quinone oxidoreductase subunit G